MADDEELVATEPPDVIAIADRAVEHARRRLQHLVADGVTAAVVDRLEVVEVEEDRGGATVPG